MPKHWAIGAQTYFLRFQLVVAKSLSAYLFPRSRIKTLKPFQGQAHGRDTSTESGTDDDIIECYFLFFTDHFSHIPIFIYMLEPNHIYAHNFSFGHLLFLRLVYQHESIVEIIKRLNLQFLAKLAHHLSYTINS